MQDGVLTLDTGALRVLVVLLHIHKSQYRRRRHDETEATVKVRQTGLMERTGYTRQASVSDAVHSLQRAGLIHIDWDRRGSTKRGAVSSVYSLTRPDTGAVLTLTEGRVNVLGPLGLPYFQIPTCVISSTERWALRKLTGSELKLYIALLWSGAIERSFEFERTNVQLYKQAGIGLGAFTKALDGLEDCGLIYASGNIHGKEAKMLSIHLCDPLTRQPLEAPDGDDENDPQNYFTPDAKGGSRRLAWNRGSAEDWERRIRAAIQHGEPINEMSDGNLKIRCPFHAERTPSCSISPKLGCFHCFGCGEKGTLLPLIAKLTGSRKSAIQRITAAGGQLAEFHQPDTTAIRRFDYRDTNGSLVKRKLRFPDAEDGSKVWAQRQWTSNGWVPHASKIGPLLYHAELLAWAKVVCVTEGERDSDTLTRLELMAGGCPVIGITSGDSGSWHQSLAKQLRDKRVVIMPDDDARGTNYAESVRASLEAENIECRMTSFAGTGAKDVSAFMEGHSVEDLVRLIGVDWVRMPDDTSLDDSDIPPTGEISI
jgi:5S rRNA maturation endonuclease (ribonuclease M5)